MLIIVIINVNDLDLDSVIQCLYLINNLQESLITLFIYLFIYLLTGKLVQHTPYFDPSYSNIVFSDSFLCASRF